MLEEKLDAKDKDTQNIYASITNSLKTEGLVAEKYSDTVIKALNAAMSGRYGEGGSKAAMTWITENNPAIDAGVYQKLMTVVEANYTKFEVGQREKIDILREYKTKLRTFPSNIIASAFGYPKKDLEKLGQIIINDATQKAIDSGKAEAINPFSESK